MFLLIFLLFYINWLMAHCWGSKLGSLSLKKFLSQRTQWKWTKYVQIDKCCDQNSSNSIESYGIESTKTLVIYHMTYFLFNIVYILYYHYKYLFYKILYITPVYHNLIQENKKTTGPCTIEIHVINRILGSCNLNTCIIKLSWNMLSCFRNVIKLSELKNISLAIS